MPNSSDKPTHARSGSSMRTSPEVGECDLFRGDCCPVDGASSRAAEIGLMVSDNEGKVGGMSMLRVRTAPVFLEIHSIERESLNLEGTGELELEE